MTHTKGPWVLRNYMAIDSSDGLNVAVTHNTQGIHETAANARLIAAAPELFEALKSCAASLLYAADALEAPKDSMMRANLINALNTIKKAKGE